MKIQKTLLLCAILICPAQPAGAAEPNDLTACAAVTATDAEKFVGASLEVTKIDKKIMLNAPWTHDSHCTYTPKAKKPTIPQRSHVSST